MNRLFLLVILCLSLSSCMYKSVMKDEADDIVKAAICSYDGKSCLVMLEKVYQATYKEGGRGLTITTGFNELRISVYNLDDGSLLIRKKTGRENRYPVEFLGCTEGNLWFYSFKDGIHSLNTETLEISVTQDSIFSINPEIKDKLATCEWYQLSQYFQFNDITKKVVLTDNQGYRYLMDTESLLAEKVTWEYKSFNPGTDQSLKTNINFPPSSLYLSGELRKQIKVNNKEVNPGLTFLDGKFIVDRDPARVIERVDNRLSWQMIQMEDIFKKIMPLNALNNGSGPQWGTPQRDTLRKLEDSKYRLGRDINMLGTCRNDIMVNGQSHSYDQLLSPDTTTFFVFHASGTQKEANVVISRIELKNNVELQELWSTEIPDLFHDPNAARETNTFKKVFSKGDPEFRFSYITLENDKLIIIWMLHVHCINIANGKILWKFRV